MNGELLAICAYMLIQLVVGVYAMRHIHTEKDYLIAGRTVGFGLGTVSLFATWFGSETVMGSSARIAEFGLSGARADPFGYSLALLLMAIFLSYKMRSLGLVTLSDFFRRKFDRHTEVLSAFIMMGTATIWSAAQLLAFATILSMITPLPLGASLLLATGLTMIYITLGGLLGDIITDFIQGIVLIIGLAILLVMVFIHAGGLSAGFALIEPSQLSLVAPGESFWTRLDLWMIPVLGSLVSQEATSRTLSMKSPEIARRSAYAASLLYFCVACIPLLIALIGRHFDFHDDYSDNYIIVVARELLPSFLFVIFIGALLSAILSTINSTFLSVGSLFSHNILRGFFPDLSDKKKLLSARICVAGAGVVAYLLASRGDSIYELLMTESSFGTAGLLVVVFMGLYRKHHSSIAASATLALAMVMTFLSDHLELEAPFLTSVITCLATYLVLDTFFRHVHPRVWGRSSVG